MTTPAVATVPEMFEDGKSLSAAPLPMNDAAVTSPVTPRLERVPRLVMLIWAGFVTTPAVATVPAMLEAWRLFRAAPLPANDAAVTAPVTPRLERVPRLVMLIWAGFVTTPEVATVPAMLEAWRLFRAAPLPTKDAAVTAPVTARLERVPRLVILGWAA